MSNHRIFVMPQEEKQKIVDAANEIQQLMGDAQIKCGMLLDYEMNFDGMNVVLTVTLRSQAFIDDVEQNRGQSSK